MICPPYLKVGDTIAIIAGSCKTSEQELKPCVETLKSWGFKIALGKNIFNQWNDFAGTDDERAKDLQNALDNPDIKAIILSRGGYGLVRIIDKINFDKFRLQPKWVIGYSDACVLLQHIQAVCGVQTIHGPMANSFPKATSSALQSLQDILSGKPATYKIEETVFSDLNRKGNAQGILTGGNLSIICSLCGSSSEIDTKGKILFIEDIDEYLYHIDRIMFSLKRSGKLEHLAGLIVGGMTNMKDNTIQMRERAEDIIYKHVVEYNYPVCFGFPAGHLRDNKPLILGRYVSLKVSSEIELVFQ